MIKEILKSDVGILNKYFLITLILVLLTIVGYTSYALFSYEEISTTGIRIKYTGKPKQSEGNLANSWKDKTENELNYLAIYTVGSSALPETYSYNGTIYNLNTTIDVSEQSNGNVMLGEYKNGSNIIGVIGQDGKVMAPVDSSNLFFLGTNIYLNPESNLQVLDLSNLDTSKVTNMTNMFKSCSSLTSLDVSNFDTSNVTDMYQMFYFCSSLTSLDLSNFNTSKVTNMQYMFASCSNLTSVIVGCSWTTANVTTSSGMFNSAGTSEVTNVC